MRLRLLSLIVAAALGCASLAAAQTPDSLEAAKRRELEEIQQQAAEKRAAAKRLKGQEVKELGNLKRTETALRKTRQRINLLKRRRENLDTQLEITRINVERSLQSLGTQRSLLARRLRNIYKFGPAREIEYLLSTQSFAQLLSRWDFFLMIAEQDRQMLEDVRERKVQVETLERRLEGHLTQIDRTARQTSSENQRLAQQRSQRQTAVRDIQTQRAAYEAAAEELEKTARSVRNLITTLERKRREEADRARAQGREPQPYTGDFARGQGALDWPVRGELVGRFGPEKHPRFGTTVLNNGIDIATGIGSPVHAVAKGRVDYASDDYGTYGQMLILNHGDGYYTLYGHLSEIRVAVGQEVTPSQVIGLSGDTGSLKGAILHFEVRKGAAAVNPEDWLQ